MAKKKKRRKKRGPGPVILVVLTGIVCCWMGLVKVDRQIRAVTINQSPPLWESQGDGDILRVILLGRTMEIDLSPVRGVGEAVVEVLRTPSAPMRLAQGAWELAAEGIKPKPQYSWQKGFL